MPTRRKHSEKISTEIAIRRVTDADDTDAEELDLDAPVSEDEERRAVEATRKRDYRLRKRIQQPIRDESDLSGTVLAVFERKAQQLASMDQMPTKEINSFVSTFESVSREMRMWRELQHKESDIQALWETVRELKKQLARGA